MFDVGPLKRKVGDGITETKCRVRALNYLPS